MKVLTRYVAREFAQNFFLGLAAFSATYLVVDFFERINAFLVNQAPWPVIGVYFLNKLPSILYQVAPAAVLLSVILTLGLFSRHNEILAMKSGGVGLSRLVLPILGEVILIFLALLALNELILPSANQNARAIRDRVIHKKDPVSAFKQSQIWIHGQQGIYNIRLYHPEKNLLEGFTLYRFGPDFELRERVDARSARWEDGKWLLSHASVTEFGRGGIPARKNYPQMALSLPESPADFLIAERNPNEMNFRQLREYVNKIERDGYDAAKYKAAMHASLSYPFITVIMAVLGIPLALRKERGAGLALGVGLSILVSFLYLVFYSFILELGKGATLPPFLGAWLGNFVFGLVGVYLLLSVRH